MAANFAKFGAIMETMQNEIFFRKTADNMEDIASSYAYLNASLMEMDADDWTSKLTIMAGAMVFNGVTLVSFLAVLQLILTQDSEVPFRNKILASFQASRCAYAFLAISGAVYTLLTPTNMSVDIVAGKSSFGVFIVAFTTGFHISDTITILIGHYWLGLKNALFAFHHVLMLILYSSILITDTGYYIGCIFLLAEMPIPFITLKLLSLGLRTRFPNTVAGKINDFLMVHFFHLRNAFDVFLWSKIYFNYQDMYEKMPPAMIGVVVSFMFIMSVILVPFYIYTFSKMCLSSHLAESAPDKLKNGKQE